jgi:hypothetical protein
MYEGTGMNDSKVPEYSRVFNYHNKEVNLASCRIMITALNNL